MTEKIREIIVVLVALVGTIECHNNMMSELVDMCMLLDEDDVKELAHTIVHIDEFVDVKEEDKLTNPLDLIHMSTEYHMYNHNCAYLKDVIKLLKQYGEMNEMT